MEAFPTAGVDEYTPTLEEDPALGLSHRSKMEILFAVMLGMFLGALDQTIVGPALPTIVTQLSGNDYYVWAITIYLLTSTISVPFWGKLSDVYGRKPIYMLGIVIFLIGSALSGLSQNMGMLILFRGIQGVGAGALFPVALAIIGDLFTPQERGKYQGLFGAVFGIAFVVGPLLGGFLTENFGWHWIFYVNIPIGIVALFVIQRLLPTVKTPRASKKFDIVGGAIFTVAISFLLVGLTNKQFGDWTDPTVGGFILIGIIGSLVFLFAESRAAEPIVPLDLWRSRTYSASMVATFFAAFAFFGAIVFLPRWFQVVEGFSPTNSGLAVLPLMVGLIVSSVVSGLIVSRTGRYKWLLVGAIALMGCRHPAHDPADLGHARAGGLAVDVHRRPRRRPDVLGLHDRHPERGAVQAARRRNVEPDFFRQIGGTIALAFVGTIFATTFEEKLVPSMAAAGVPQPVLDGFAQASSSGCVDLGQLTGVGDLGAALLAAIPAQFQAAVAPYIDAMVEGIHGAFSLATAQTFWLGVVGSIAAVVAASAIKEIPLRTTNEATGPDDAAVAGGSEPGGHSRPSASAAGTGRPATDAVPSAGRPRRTPSGSRFSAPAGARPARYDAEHGPPTRPVPATLLASGSTPMPRFEPSWRSPSCRRARCAGSAVATSTSSSPTRPTASSRPTTAARTCPRRCRSASSTAASWRARSTKAASTCRAATRPRCRRPAASTPTASTTRRGRRPAATRRSIRPARRPRPGG